ncbi:hypothetical protein PF010_g26755 [Phytophthora fragariae]|uniref:Uncharacterized protein n=1 Tax=Phytophthora fragariae TaxID=53985 RepID=A0A6G0JWI0_9STRA|nr:hypothetical protein PF010_g26755 [Phytophthora fragariae]KAE9176022.1 hypothetical protein PF004_g26214 [Phytophthora fragariae]
MQYLQCVSASRYVAVEVRCSSLRNDVPDDAGEGQDAIDTDASVTSGAVKGSNMGSTLHLLGIYAHGNRATPEESSAHLRFRLKSHKTKTAPDAQDRPRSSLQGRADDYKAGHRKAGTLADDFEVSTAQDPRVFRLPKNEAEVSLRAELDRADEYNVGTARPALSPMISNFRLLKMLKGASETAFDAAKDRADDI